MFLINCFTEKLCGFFLTCLFCFAFVAMVFSVMIFFAESDSVLQNSGVFLIVVVHLQQLAIM